MVKQIKKRWLFRLGVGAAALGGAAAFVLRGCWHTRMSWPIRQDDCAYQVCLGCGIKRLFDEKAFRAYGSFGYDLHELLARDRAMRMRKQRKTA